MYFRPSDNSFEVSWVNLGRRFPAFVAIDRRGRYEKTSQTARLVDSPLAFSSPQPRRSTRWVRTTVVGVGNRCSLSRGTRRFGHQGRGANNRQDGLSEIGREQWPVLRDRVPSVDDWRHRSTPGTLPSPGACAITVSLLRSYENGPAGSLPAASIFHRSYHRLPRADKRRLNPCHCRGFRR